MFDTPTVILRHMLAAPMLQFVEKDPKLAELVVRQLLRFWPLTNSQKEVLFLGELEEILELTQPAEFQKLMVPLFKQLAKCLTSAHFQVQQQGTNSSQFSDVIRSMSAFCPRTAPHACI